ncbi:MAG TPA: hypothetical protein VJS69_05385 [Candidatus Krumholzibacteria bacterium]|nr:hypothetical protein [Candidatus Krumholzibacteria bacterium]
MPIRPALRPHIQLASALLRAPIDASERAWRAGHYDLLIGVDDPDAARAINPYARIFAYSLIRVHRFEEPPKPASQWALAHGYDPEDFYLHYKEDIYLPTWEGKVIVPGFPAGMVPGWNPGGGGKPASATTRAQSRVIGYYGGTPQPSYFANIANPGFKQFMAERITGLINGTWYSTVPFATGPVDGIMGDEAIWYAIYKEGALDHSVEYYGIPLTADHPYAIAIEQFYPYLSETLLRVLSRTEDVMPNYGHVLFLNYNNRSAINIQSETPWVWGEVWVTYTGASSPTTGNNRCITYNWDYDNAVKAIIRQTRSGGRRVIGARDIANGTAGTDRGKLFTLGLYYLVHNENTYYMYETASGHALPGHVSTWQYNPAVDYDIGEPQVLPGNLWDFENKHNTREHWVYASGPDPYNPSLTYQVLARRFAHALVLVKMLPEGSVDDARSITVHPLGGSYRPLNADGTLGAPVTQASIRNNEALILIPETVTGIR